MFIRFLLIAIALALASQQSFTQEPSLDKDKARAKAQAALSLAHLQHEPVKTDNNCLKDLAAARKLASESGKPLLVWVGGCGGKCVKDFRDCIHAQVPAWNGDTTPKLIVPKGSWDYWWPKDAVNVPQVRALFSKPGNQAKMPASSKASPCCSPACRCGCNETGECQCDKLPRTSSPAILPATSFAPSAAATSRSC